MWSKILLWEVYIVRTVLWQSFGIQSINRLAVNLFHWLIKSKSSQERLPYYVEFHFLKHIDLTEFVYKFWEGSWKLWQNFHDLFLIQGWYSVLISIFKFERSIFFTVFVVLFCFAKQNKLKHPLYIS